MCIMTRPGLATVTLLTLLLMSSRYAEAALPTSFNITSYNLTLVIPSNTTVGSTLTGNVIMKLLCVTDTGNVTFHWGSALLPSTPTSSNITMTVTASTLASAGTFDVTKNSTDDTVTLTMTNPTTLTAGEVVTLNIGYQTTVSEDITGIFFRNYSNGDGTNGSFIGTNTWPTYARNILPCLDEPRYNATWNLTLVTPSSWVVATSFNLTSNTTTSTTSMSNLTYNATTYLPANSLSFFLSGNMTNTTYTRGNFATPLTFWSGSGLNGTQLSNNISCLADYFYLVDDILSTNFTLTNMNIVLVPNLEMTFSSLGIVYIREDQYTESYSSAQEEGMFRMRELPVLRQFLKQYSGFSTRPQSWADLWITEAAAGYLESIILAQVNLPFDFTPDLEVVDRQTALALDTVDSMPLQDTTINYNSTAAIMVSIADPLKRTKGAVLMNMLDTSLPAGLIFSTIKNLLTQYKGREINSTQFYALINSTVINSGSFLSTGTTVNLQSFPVWFNSSGYPLLNVTASSTGTPGNVSFLMSVFCGNATCTDSLKAFYLSATVGSKTQPRYSVLRQNIWVTNSNTATTGSLNINSGDWLVANMQSSGYYRATYNSTGWSRLVTALAKADDEIVGRSQLLDDAFALSAANLLSYNTTLALASANLQESLFRNWYPIHQGLWDIRDKLWNTNQYSIFQTFATALLENLDSLLTGGTLDSYQQARIASLFWDGMCEMDVSNYRTYAKGNLSSFLNGVLPSTVDSSAYESMVCCGAQHTSSLNATTLWNTLANFTSSYYTKHFNAIALGCMSNFTDVSSLFTTVMAADAQYYPYVATTLQFLAQQQASNLSSVLPAIATTLQTKLGAATVVKIIMSAAKKLNSTQATTLSTALNATTVDDIIKNVGATAMSAATMKTSWLASYNASLVSALEVNTASAVASAAISPTAISFTLLVPVTVVALVAVF